MDEARTTQVLACQQHQQRREAKGGDDPRTLRPRAPEHERADHGRGDHVDEDVLSARAGQIECVDRHPVGGDQICARLQHSSHSLLGGLVAEELPGLDEIDDIPIRTHDRADDHRADAHASQSRRPCRDCDHQQNHEAVQSRRLRSDRKAGGHGRERDVATAVLKNENRCRQKERRDDEIVLRERCL